MKNNFSGQLAFIFFIFLLLLAGNCPAQTMLTPTADSYVRDGTYATSNYGTSTTLQTKLGASGYTRQAFVKFDLSTVTGTVASAKLRMYGKVSGTSGLTATHVYGVADDSWTESGVTWNNKPAASGSSLANMTIGSTTGQWYEWNVLAFVQSEKSAGQNIVSFVLKHDVTCTPNNDLNSREAASNKPQLVITTSTGTNISPSASISSPANGATYAAPASISIGASATDSDGSVSKVEFFSGTGLIGSDTSSPYAITWNGVGSGTYSLTARATDNGGATGTSGAVVVTVASSSSSSAGPVDNPVSSHYSGAEGYPAWTDSIKWNNVINMSAYGNGANDFQKFENARDQLHAQGGGVLYYPSGTYNFSNAPADGPSGRGLMLKSGVVVRGVKSTTDSNGADGTIDLPTKFLFSFQTKGGGQVPRDWNIIGIMPATGQQLKDVNNVGIAYVHVMGGTVYFGPQLGWGSTWATAGSWKSAKVKETWKNRVPDGTHPVDPFAGSPTTSTTVLVGSGRLVFGCKFDDSAVMNDCIDEGFGAGGFHMYKFGPRIGVYGKRVLVANNVLPKSTRNFKYQQLTSSLTTKTVLWDYGRTCGIDVNKEMLGLAKTGFFQDAVIVRDNWVWNHGHKGLNISGLWGVIKNNRNERVYLKEGDDPYGLGAGYELTLDGYNESQAGGSGSVSDNLARAFDIGGKALWIDNNTFNNTGSDPGNDGEGILCQLHGGTQLHSWAITRNIHTQGTGEAGYIGGYDVTHYGSLIAWNTTPGWCGNVKAGAQIDAATVSNNAAGGVQSTGTDVLTTCPSGSPSAPSNVSATVNGDFVRVAWADSSSSEIGFRVERSIDNGTWTTISYRPRRSSGTAENEQAWNDYFAPKGRSLRYRVVAINCDDTATGASVATTAVTLP